MNENAFISIEEFESARQYWLTQLGGDLEEIRLPLDFPRQPRQENEPGYYSRYETTLDPALTEKLFRLAKNQDLLLYVILVAVFKILIYKYTGQADIITVSPIYTQLEESDRYNKTILLREIAADHLTFRQWLGKVKNTVFEGYKNQHYPLENVMKLVGVREKGVHLNRAAVVLENIHQDELLQDMIAATALDLILAYCKDHEKITVTMYYPAALFREETVRRLEQANQFILRQVLDEINILLKDIEVLSSAEKHRLVFDFNATARDYPGAATIPQWYARQVEKTPHSVALVETLEINDIYEYPGLENDHNPYIYYRDDSMNSKISVHYAEINRMIGQHRQDSRRNVIITRDLTYEGLNREVRRAAASLAEKGIKPHDLVGIMVEPSLSLVVGILAILTVGGVYLPLDPSYPPERIDYLLKDSGARLLITRPAHAANLQFSGEILSLDTPNREGSTNKNSLEEPINPIPTITPQDPVYVIYTSGSTGKPKGVLIRQGSLANLIHWRTRAYSMSPADVTLQLISVSFDVFGANLYSSLLSGGKLVLLAETHKGDFDYVRHVIRECGVTTMSVVPVMYRVLLEKATEKDMHTMRLIVLGGEKSTAALLDLSREINPGITLVNEYGPTENTITTTSSPELTPANTAVIGKPIANTTIYILDNHLRLKPVGAAGELCIAGEGIAMGYLNQPERTAETFLLISNNHHRSDRSDRSYKYNVLYRTGDLARWQADGTIEFLGRVDDQVKVFGHRIEPGEIEARLSTLEPIKEAVVRAVPREDGYTHLCAFYTAGKELGIPEMREHLAITLPDYMIPSYFVRLEQIPLTGSGKIDQNALMAAAATVKKTTRYEAPKTNREQIVARAWQEILKVDKVGIHDNFFDLGGNSMSAIQVENHLGKIFGITINNITKMFENPTVATYTRYLEQLIPGNNRVDENEERTGADRQENIDRAMKTMAIIGETNEN